MSNKVFCDISISADGYLSDGLDAALDQARTAAELAISPSPEAPPRSTSTLPPAW